MREAKWVWLLLLGGGDGYMDSREFMSTSLRYGRWDAWKSVNGIQKDTALPTRDECVGKGAFFFYINSIRATRSMLLLKQGIGRPSGP